MLQKKVFFYIATIYLSLLCYNATAQNFHKIEFIVRDSLTQQPLTNVLVNIPKIDTVTETNEQGQVSLNLLQNNYVIIVNYPGNKPKHFQLNLEKDTVIIVFLSSRVRHYLIPEVEVTGNHFDKSENVYAGLERVRPLTIKSFPSLFGEKDVVKTLSSLPGVAQGSEGAADIYVRGGTTDQNLFLIDGNMIYHPSHLFGFFSSVVPDIIEEVDFYKGSFPVNYGGKLSSVIDIKTKDPLQDTFNVKAELSTLSGKITLEAPVIKDKTSILLSARTTHFDKIIKAYISGEDYSVAGFYELFGKVDHKINEGNSLMVDLYFDRDYYLQGGETEGNADNDHLKWKNQFVSAKYTHVFPANGTLSATAGWTKYKMQILEESSKKDSTLNYTKDFNSYIDDKYLKLLFEKKSDNQLNLLLGADYIVHDISPATVYSTYSDTTYTQSIIPSNIFYEISAYASNFFLPYPNLKIQTGVRFSCMINKSSRWYSLDPRLNVQYLLKNDNSVKLSYTKVSQAIHLLTNPGLGMPIDIHIPFSDDYEPEYAHQYSIATNLKKKIHGRMFYFTAEAYYKQMKNIVSYLPGKSSRNFTAIISNKKDIDEIVTTGQGKSYGIELLLEKPFGKLNGRMAYTLSGIKHQFGELNNGKEFYAQHHRPHNLVMVASYNFNQKHILSANFNYMSGARTTLPIFLYNQYYFGIAGGYTYDLPHGGVPFYAQSEINEYKMKDFHTLSLSYLYKFRKRRWNGEWEFSVYNVYNRKNPYYYYLDYKYVFIDNDDSKTGFSTVTKPALVYVSLFRMIPSVTFRMSF
ncbi:TonB-dependent receptor [Maribellus maritimus]|uniref:TonB-dependent receptor n=1 Tax=Maribellus maritimus TaxID=2870838 RepID=UPI001EEBDD7D|nr:TonB-dependent receptor plug domain-containing protein [Maribellus maritimus]MCG6191416.1 TonB-dependent receptor [Maribellus maritimus]